MMLDVIERETGPNPQWAVIWLHGLGADGSDFAPMVPELVRPQWPALRFVFPHAPIRAITINNGVRMRGWYDIVGMDFAQRADKVGIAESVAQVEALIANEQARGIAPERILLAGFSQGGAVTLAVGLQRRVPLAGLIAMSTYLPDPAAAASQLQPGALAQPLFMAHGSADPVVPYRAGEQSAQALQALGFMLEWHSYPMGHQVCVEEIDALRDWMQARFTAV
ncbi:alpha/beta hydrolase [Xanthomonas campestris pv. campestris]|uniref:alpha/beta hydrolase n=1 Tax=Xanthomonas campestris TaxID=339 RepID=UPI00236508AE|nr:alpha/beta hydrolase [Xanthomonas campestris]MEA0763082.1 alpha/beta hydrolase [Xanthomonas campestris pv. campestris]MEB1222623.1 alpha/beta hydrolase [Xanthomonas campestris pv. campestris]MEB1243424.1 alpha/beta hydrolase [Xanthomonas campestris pv. campestris]MEB1251765.1 alpha/beta hydrolase [Xanthomonas campestris pv. campestris]MEB1293160.1 alpha/beta hydrolase [Xanthomonas campestris pv. campestris]